MISSSSLGMIFPEKDSHFSRITLKAREDSGENSLLHRLLAFGVALGGACQDLLRDQAGVLADRHLDLGGHVGIGLEEGFRVLAALAEPLAVIGEPGAGLLDDACLDAEIEEDR